MADAYEQLGKYDEALAFLQKWEQTIGRNASRARTAELYAHMGKKREAMELLGPTKTGALEADAFIYCSLGNKDRAIAMLQSAAESHSMMPFILVDPRLDSLRSDPRFQQMLRRAKIPS